jgi:hypothetical protein
VGKFYPFDNEQDNGQVALLQELPDQYDVLALANLSNFNVINFKPNLPPQSVLVRMFSPLSSSLDPKAGGLGIDKADFMREANKGDYETAAKKVFALYPACGTGNWPAEAPLPTGWTK